MFKLLWSLWRPPAPPRPPDAHAPVVERDGRGAFYRVRSTKVRFVPHDHKHHAIVRLIAATGVFPPKGAGVARRMVGFGLHDNATDTDYRCDQTQEDYLRTLALIRADRAEMLLVSPLFPQDIDWSAYGNQS